MHTTSKIINFINMSLQHSLIVSEYRFTAFVSQGYKVMKFPCEYMLTWKAGTDKTSGTKSLPSQESGVIPFEDQLQLVVKVSKNTETGEYQKKKSMIYLNIKTENHPEFREILHIVLRLGEFIESDAPEEYKEYYFEKDKDSKLMVKIHCEKLRDVNSLGYTPEHQRSSSYFGSGDAPKELLNSRYSERSTERGTSSKGKQIESGAVQRLSQELELALSKSREQERVIFNLKMSQEQLVLTQIDLESKIQELTDKNVNDELKIAELDLKLEQLIDVQSELQNLKWENNQLKSEIETAKRINEARQSFHFENSGEVETENERVLQDKLDNIQSQCTTLLYQLKEREEGRQEIEQRFLMTEEECRNLNQLLEQKDIEVISLKEKIERIERIEGIERVEKGESLSENQFTTPVKAEEREVETIEMGIQYSDVVKSEDRKEYMTPQLRRGEQEQFSKELKDLQIEIQLKNQEINRLMDVINSTQQQSVRMIQQSLEKEERTRGLEKRNSELREDVERLTGEIEKREAIIEEYRVRRESEGVLAKAQEMGEKMEIMEEEVRTLQGYVQTLQEENKELARENQQHITLNNLRAEREQEQERERKEQKQRQEKQRQQRQQKQRQEREQQNPPQQQKPLPSQQSPLSSKGLRQSGTIQKSRIKELKSLVQNLQQQNRFIISKAKQEQQENNKLRSKLHESQRLIDSLKREISLDAQDIELIKLELEKQKQINENVDHHLSAEKSVVCQLTQKLVRTQEEYMHVTKELEDLHLRRSRKREKKEHSKAKYEGEIKALSDEVIRLHEELFRLRMIEEARESNTGNTGETLSTSLKRNLFVDQPQPNPTDTLSQSLTILKQILSSFPTNQTVTLLQDLLSQRPSKNRLSLDYISLKQRIDSRLREANSSLQKIKGMKNIGLEERRRIVSEIRPVQECISTILQMSVGDL